MRIEFYAARWIKRMTFEFDQSSYNQSLSKEAKLAQVEEREDLFEMAVDNPTMFVAEMEYRLVACLDAPNLDKAWELTNTINGPWWLNEEIVGYDFRGEDGHRSACIGDMYRADGKLYVVTSAGYMQLGQNGGPEPVRE